MPPADEAGAERADAITLRYRVTPALARRTFWYTLGEWSPVLVGLGLLTLLCATWSPLGQAGRMAAIVAPAAAVLFVLWCLGRARKSVESYRGRDIIVAFAREGLRFDTGLARSEMPWSSLRQIARRRSFWLLQVRTGSRFLVPTGELSAEERAEVAGWAAAAGVRLT